jgi:cytidine deaminase
MNRKEADELLIEEARNIMKLRFKQGFHHVGAALRTRSNRVFSAVHLEANVGRVAVCAEAIAIGVAAAAGDTEIETIVAVNRKGEIVSPCGMCRELISDFSPSAKVIVPSPKGFSKVGILDLLPNKYKR